mmetsp:Transcript_22721/g.32473  ORF Transcript_22721/g.32473 Transcript_22721/m.32473 type:complete len:457 (-) Transcript_22721:55-1425(-)|eukprot:CAMPEP_0201697894 /NCGR_PEP_ID=MMETSP0578-20130828/15033_1 /ASSEMBLY_ACC=CAM_ASM_000663 /TAXON_ID=267565 /ORGANISM="Skeletonema grethea, Strain CCMP 1804" /LENGTH=456 /DNA_ID=CAMNT_0048184253 /DNA_START=108 /DNA_END=1478 /DNA_ORIENTATION=+
MSPSIDIQTNRDEACRRARRSSDDFSDTYGDSALDSIPPFENDEVQLGPRAVGSGAFASVYPIRGFNLRADGSKNFLGVSIANYTGEQMKKRETTAISVDNGAKYVMKSLKDKLEDSDKKELFLDSAQDIVTEAEMLAAFSHPNIIKLHGIIANRHDSFAEGPSAFFIILERLESTLDGKIEEWKKQYSFNPKASFTSLRNSLSSSMIQDKVKVEKSTLSEGGSLDSRLRMATSLADAMQYLHSQDVIFHDLKPENIGLDRRGNIKLFDFGLAKFMPKDGDSYKDVYEMDWAGTPRYAAPEVVFYKPYNLKADVYSFSVVLWEMIGLKRPFPKCKTRTEFEEALPKLDKVLAIDRRWPQPIQDVIKSGLCQDLFVRPTMKEIYNSLDDYVTNGVENSDADENTRSPRSQFRRQRRSSFTFPSANRNMRKLRSSSTGSHVSGDSLDDMIEEINNREQ